MGNQGQELTKGNEKGYKGKTVNYRALVSFFDKYLILFVGYDSLIPKGQTKIVPNQMRNNGQNTDLKAANIDSKKFFI